MEDTWIIEDKYEVISKIKQGGFGIVYYGFDRKFEKPIAIKAIEPSLLQEAKYIDMFLKEAKNAAKLNHNNIVHVYDLIKTNDGQFYIIMEYIDGVDLRRIINKCKARGIRLPLELSLYLMKEVCKALEYAHNKKDLISNEPLRLVHQDISPSNIMVSVTGTVKLIDFGIAKIKFQNNGSPQSIVLAGKLPYMAPDQLNGSMVDNRTDIFSLGIVFFELLTNSMLFHYDNDEKIIEAVKKVRIDNKFLSQYDIPGDIQNILIKILQKNPEDRYQGANNLYIDLVEYLMSLNQSVELSVRLGNFVQDLLKNDLKNIKNSDSGTEPSNGKQQPATGTPSRSKTEITENGYSDIFGKNEFFDADFNQQQQPPPGELTPQNNLDEQIPKKEPDSKPLEDNSPSDENNSANSNEVTIDAENNSFSDENKHSDIESPSNQDSSSSFSFDLDQLELEKELSQFDTTSQEKTPVPDIPIPEPDVVPENSGGTFMPSEAPQFDEEEQGEDDIKTVIDVIRLSAKTHKRPLIFGMIGSLSAIIIFMILNIAFRWTALGEQIYDYFFPPAIKINSVPAGANVFIDDKKVPGKTPLTIGKISPGIHKLKLILAGYSDLSRSLTVPSSGEVQIDGEKSRKGYEPYLFRFKTKIELSSDPIEATVFINNIKYKQQTPTILEWEVGKPLNIEMSKPGFQDLTGFSLNTDEESVNIEDHRLWNFKTAESGTKKYIIEGLFKKFISVSSLPNGATFYLDGSPTPTGKTGSSQAIALSVGKHDVLFTRAGFNSKRVSVTVDENGPKSIFVSLTRNVRFFAKDVTVPNDNDIGATISRIYRQGRSYSRKDKTPCEIALPLVNHKVLIKKEGYKDAVVLVSPKSKVIVARMEPENSSLEVEVTDALTGQPVENAQINYYSMNSRLRDETYFGSTNDRGWCRNKLEPGQYTFVVKKIGYFEKSANINTLTETKKLSFKLIVQ